MKIELDKITSRIPFIDQYVYSLGVVVYMFSYFESTIVDIASCIDSNFRTAYYRKKPQSYNRLMKNINSLFEMHELSSDLLEIANDFGDAIDDRNRLVHSNPITDKMEDQILNYQSDVAKKISDFKWNRRDIQKFKERLEFSIIKASNLLDKLR